jgi:hypothetical protein
MLSRSLKTQFATAIRRMLRPVVRQLIAYGISYPAFTRIVKQVYVEVAQQEFALPFKRQTDSRLALVTGINRKEVSQLRRQSAGFAAVAVEDTLVTRLIGRWMAGPPYADADAKPQRLPYDAPSSRTPSFARLVRESGADVPVRSVLDELVRLGLVELLPNGDVVLRREAHIPAGAAEGKLTLLGSDPGELFSTIVHNIEHPEAPRLQRKVVYDNVGAQALDKLRAAARSVGEQFIREANALLASYDRDRNPQAPGGPPVRVALGAYYFEEEGVASAPSQEPGGERQAAGRIRRTR